MVSRMLAAMGYEVYDCDRRARDLIDGSRDILSAIASRISGDVVSESWVLDRKALAEIVFGDDKKLRVLNGITHAAVRKDVATWAANAGCSGRPVFVETAILYTSGLDRVVDMVWEVTAPTEMRIARAMSRDNADRVSVERRVASQQSEAASGHGNVKCIVNDGITAVVPQVLSLLKMVNNKP